MNSPFDTTPALENFTGEAPLFPLPNVVCFPHVLLPLHIFEPRYRQMTADALAGDRLIAMALIQPDAFDEIAGSPPIFETVCLGKIVTEQILPDGRYHLILQGLSRARVIAEVENGLPYRVGRLELCEDRYPAEALIDRRHRYHELLSGFRELHAPGDLEQVLHQALDADIPLGVLCDVLAYAMQLDVLTAQRLLDEIDVDFRSDLVLDELRTLVRRQRQRPRPTFPPQFSRN